MRFLFRWFVVGCLVLYGQAIQAQQLLNTVPANLSDTIPFQMSSGFLILVEGRIGPLVRLTFVLDTGTSTTVVDAKIADKLSLPRDNVKANVLRFGRNTQLERANLPEIGLGPLSARNFPVTVGDLKQISDVAEGVDAIVGLDLLRTSQKLKIDYGERLVTFKPSIAGGLGRSQVNAFTVQMSVQGRSICLILDTGLQGLVLYSDRLHKHVPNLKFSGKFSHAHEGWLMGETATLPGIRLGTEDLKASVLLIHEASDPLPADIDGYFGPRGLGAQMIELDFESNKLLWLGEVHEQLLRD